MMARSELNLPIYNGSIKEGKSVSSSLNGMDEEFHRTDLGTRPDTLLDPFSAVEVCLINHLERSDIYISGGKKRMSHE